MFIYCCGSLEFSENQKCKYCDSKAIWYCKLCKSWYLNDRTLHFDTENHKNNDLKIKDQTRVESIKIFGFYQASSKTTLNQSIKAFVASPNTTIPDLKFALISYFEKECKNEPERFYIVCVRKNEICDEFKNISFYFNNLDFVILTKKTFIETQVDKLLNKIINWTLKCKIVM